jgi:hypothetical protein
MSGFAHAEDTGTWEVCRIARRARLVNGGGLRGKQPGSDRAAATDSSAAGGRLRHLRIPPAATAGLRRCLHAFASACRGAN